MRWTAVGGASIVAYSYAGYPAIVFGLSRLRRGVPPDRRTLPSVTVVVAAYREAAVIGDKIRNTLALADEVASLRVVVVVDGEDGTADAARCVVDERVTVLHQPTRRGKSAALHEAFDHAVGDIVVMTDANAMIVPGSLASLCRWFADPRVGAVSGAKTVVGVGGVADSESAYWRYESRLKQWETAIGSTMAVVGELLAIRRELLPRLAPDTINDDFAIAMHVLRCGRRVVYEPAARTTETLSTTLAEERERRRRIAAGRAQSLARWQTTLPWWRPAVLAAVVSHKYSRPLVPWAALVSVSSSVRTLGRTRTTPRARAFAWCVVASAGVVAGLAALAPRLDRAPRRVRRASSMARHLVSANVATAAGTVDHLRRRGTVLWPRVARS